MTPEEKAVEELRLMLWFLAQTEQTIKEIENKKDKTRQEEVLLDKCKADEKRTKSWLKKHNWTDALKEEVEINTEGRELQMTSEEKNKAFLEAAKPLIKFLNDNFNPHTKIIVDCDSAEILESITFIITDEFIKD